MIQNRYPYQITKNDLYQLQNNRSNGLILSALHWLMEMVKVSFVNGLILNCQVFTCIQSRRIYN